MIGKTTDDRKVDQPTLFEIYTQIVSIEKLVLYALGEFQSRGFTLIDREIAFDRLRGAFKRTCDKFGLDEVSDERIIPVLKQLGAIIEELPSYVAKHPYRVTIKAELGIRSLKFHKRELAKEASTKS